MQLGSLNMVFNKVRLHIHSTVCSTVNSNCSLHLRSPAEKQYLSLSSFTLLRLSFMSMLIYGWLYPLLPVSTIIAAFWGVQRKKIPALFKRFDSCSKNWRSSPVPLLHAVGLLSTISISFLRRHHCKFRNRNRHPVVCISYLPYTLEPSIQAVIWLICSRGPKLQPSL